MSVSGIGGRTGEIRVEGPQSARLGHRDSPDENVWIRANLPTEPGEYRLVIGGEVTDRLTISPSEAGTTADMGYGWNGTIKRVDWQGGTSETEQEEYDPDGPDQPDAANIPGLVTGDEGGLVLSPSLRREGYTAEELGGEITIGGETYQINPADTVVRDPVTGDPVSRGPGGESGAPGEDPSQRGASGDLGDAGVALGVLAALAAGYMVMQP
ncbi:hypothetical protein [Haloplanus rubicundus]|uniref:Uncharacterized protein n=1 Tax=Haloplanus rubicundus TaxID=1547898 RepID=A0A345EBA4_9EURY|nr:hypothetical protein [Haloplanus rubicundus]AXG09476.1 hypothetical protein DU484_06120 [Haloplanus rubicundus]